MMDILFVLAIVGFFAIGIAYVYGCEKLRQRGVRICSVT
jgi:hypothetical protein